MLTLLLPALISLAYAEESKPLPNAEIKIEKKLAELRISIHPKELTHLNLDAPLKLELTGVQTKKPGPFSKDSFDKKTNTFAISLPSQPTARLNGSLKLTYSICSDDNKVCRRVIETRELTN